VAVPPRRGGWSGSRSRASRLALLALLAVAVAAPSGRAAGTPSVAALQVALARRHVYRGPIDGLPDRTTTRAVRRFQLRAHLAADGVAGPLTRAALRPFAAHPLGSREVRRGDVGWDVAELQFALAWAGYPSGLFDGRFGYHVEGAVRRFQRAHGLPVDGIAGAATIRALLRDPPPTARVVLREPVADAVLGDRFGPRGDRFHAGIDLKAPFGVPVGAAAPGRVVWAAPRAAWGLLVVVAHAGGVRTFYAHLSRIDVRLGERVAAGERLGLVGATGDATGPHLHLEVRVDGAAVDPLPLLVHGRAGGGSARQ
jgi:murein DD-endopeptidase MepM/ murein hydrolase activator NlpD